MITGYYAGVSGVYYNEQRLDVVSNNLANASTPGFRQSMLVVQARQEHPDHQSVDRDVAARTPDFWGVERTGIYKNYGKTGRLEATDNPLDVAIPSELPNAFFSVQRQGQPGDVSYTRNGTLSVGPIDQNNPNSPNVLKMSGHVALGPGNQPINIDPAGGPLAIGADGMIKQGENEVGQLPIYRFNKSGNPALQEDADLQALTQLGDSLFSIPPEYADQFHPHTIQAGIAGVDRTVVQGMREGSNVNVFSELVEMMTVQRGAQANQTVLRSQVDTLKKLFETLRS